MKKDTRGHGRNQALHVCIGCASTSAPLVAVVRPTSALLCAHCYSLGLADPEFALRVNTCALIGVPLPEIARIFASVGLDVPTDEHDVAEAVAHIMRTAP